MELRQSLEENLLLLKEKEERLKYNKFSLMFPDTGKYRRELYKKHIEFLNATKDHRTLILLGSNRSGKTQTGAYLITAWATGIYPEWWKGRRIPHAGTYWVVGKDKTTTRNILQKALLGVTNAFGSGLIPKECIIGTPLSAPGVPEGVSIIHVKHTSGEVSNILFKSYDSGVESFEGDKIDGIWLDEECPANIMTECLMRCVDTEGGRAQGSVILTFTPDQYGLSETVLLFFKDGKPSEGSANGKYITTIPLADVPHISDDEKKLMIENCPPHLRSAKIYGIPHLGSGAIYPVPEPEITCSPFKIPEYWLKCYGVDVGWNKTACVWLAIDPSTNVAYVYDVYYKGQAEPSIHAHAIRSRGEWIPGVIDPAARGRGQSDGKQLWAMYLELGLNLKTANNDVESGLYAIWQALSSGKLKIFSTCESWLREYRIYRRDEHGRVASNQADHAMDACRYAWMTGRDFAEAEPQYDYQPTSTKREGRNEITGY